MTIYHIHHYLPKHAGGTDNPENLIKVTIEEHASYHYERWILTGDQYDKISWLCLSGQISNKEANKLAMSQGGKNPKSHSKEQVEKTKQTLLKKRGVHSAFLLPEVMEKQKIALQILLDSHNVSNVSQIPEVKKKIGLKNSLHQKGKGNSQYGTIWITNGIINIKLKNTESIPEGFYKGRVIKKYTKVVRGPGFEPG